MAYGNGMVGDLCIHMFDMVRWMLGLGMPKRISSAGGRIIDPGAGFDISDTQTATFDYGELQVIWNHRAWGKPPDPRFPWAATLYGDKGSLKAGVMGYEFLPSEGPPVFREVRYELEEFPEDKTEKELEKHVAPALRAHMKNLLACRETRARPVADIEEGYMSSAACILANLSLRLGRTLEWDHAKGVVVGDDEANRLLRPPVSGAVAAPRELGGRDSLRGQGGGMPPLEPVSLLPISHVAQASPPSSAHHDR